MRAYQRNVLLDGAGPSDRVLDYPLNVLVLEGGVGLVTGLEVEYPAVAASPGATASEYLAAVEPTHKDDLLGVGNSKGLAVHLLGIENKGGLNALRDGMIGVDGPDTLSRAVSPREIAGGTHKGLEYL